MNLVNGILNAWQRTTCSHRWVRARWADGSYGMRCSNCMKAYPRTWDDLVAGPDPVPSAATPPPTEIAPLRRAA